jgi:hypothetical protein
LTSLGPPDRIAFQGLESFLGSKAVKSKIAFLMPAIVLIFSIGCSPLVYVEMLVPPKDRVAGIRSVAVITAGSLLDRRTAPAARVVAERLAVVLSKSPLYSKVRYKPNYNADKLTYDSRGFPSPDDCRVIQQELGVDAVIVVVVDHFNTRIDQRRSYVSSGFYGHDSHGHMGMTLHDAYVTYIVNGILSAKFRMLAGGEVVSEPRIPAQRIRERSDWYLSRDEVLNMLTDHAVAAFVPFIDVVTVRRPRVLKTGGEDEIKRGVKAALRERWREAENIWRVTSVAFPGNYASFYNLAVGAEVRENFEEAFEMYQKARALTDKAESFSREIGQVEDSIEALELIDAAGDPRNVRRSEAEEEPLEKTETGKTEEKTVKRRTVVTEPAEKAPKDGTEKLKPEKPSPIKPEGDNR